MTLKLNIFFTFQSPFYATGLSTEGSKHTFVPFRQCKKQSKLMGVTLRREAKDYSSHTLNFRQPDSVRKEYATHRPLPIRETTTDLFTPTGLAFEQSDYYRSLGKKGSSNKRVNKKFIQFFKHWYFDMAPLYDDNKQVREDHHSSLLVLPSYNLQSQKTEPRIPSLATLYRVMATSDKDSATVDPQPTLKSALPPQKTKNPVRSIGFKSDRAQNTVVSARKWGGFSSLIFTPTGSVRLSSNRVAELPEVEGKQALPKGGDGLSLSTVSLSTVGKGLSSKPAPQGGRPANTKLYLQNTLRGEWFLLKKVTGLKNNLTTFVNQGNNPAVKLSDKKLNARGLEAKTTNLNSILSFWSLSFVAFIIRLKLENPDLNLFLANYPFGVSSVACLLVPQNINSTPKGVEASKIKAVLLLPKTGNTPFLTLGVLPGSIKKDNPHSRTWTPYPYGVDGSHMLTGTTYGRTNGSMESGSSMVVKGVMHEGLQNILLTARVELLKQNNQIEPSLHPLVPKVGSISNKVRKLTLSALGTKKGGLALAPLDQYYGYSFSRVSATPNYPTMLSPIQTITYGRLPSHAMLPEVEGKQASMPNHQYSKKISQEEYLLFKKSQEESLFFKSPGVMGLRSKLDPDFLAYNGTYLPIPWIRQGVNTNHRNITQITKMYIKASSLLSNLVKAQAFNNGYCFSYLPPVSVASLTKIIPHLNQESPAKKNSFKKRVQKNKMSLKETSVYKFIANGLATVSVPNALVAELKLDKKLPTVTRYNIVRIHSTHQATPVLVSNRHPNVWGPTKLIESTPGLIFSKPFPHRGYTELRSELWGNATEERKINSAVSLERTSVPTSAKPAGSVGIKSENLFGVRALSGGWSCFKLDSVKSHHESTLLPLTPYVEGILFASNPFKEPHSRTSGSHMLRMGSGLGVKRLGRISTASVTPKFRTKFGITPMGEGFTTLNKQDPFTNSKGLVEDTPSGHLFLFRAAHFFQTLLWDINIYNVLWLKSLIIKNVDLTFKSHLYDKDYLRSSPSLPPVGPTTVGLNTWLLTPTYESPHNLLEEKRGNANPKGVTYAKTGPDGVRLPSVSSPKGYAKVEKNRSPQHKPAVRILQTGVRFVEGKKAGNTKLLRSFMLLMNHKKFQAKKKLTPFSINLNGQNPIKEALSSKVGKRLSTVYEMRKLEKQEYRAQKENIEAMSVRPKKRKRFYPRPDWLRVRLYETLLTPPLLLPVLPTIVPSQLEQPVAEYITVGRTIKPNKVNRTSFGTPRRVVRQEIRTKFGSSLSLKTANYGRGGFREKRSMPFYLRSSNGWGGPNNSLLLPSSAKASPTPKGVAKLKLLGRALDRGNLISNFQALFKFNPFTLDLPASYRLIPRRVTEVQVEKNINQKVVSHFDSPNILNNNLLRVWFFNTFYNFDSSNFLEVNNLSMLRIFWCLNQTNVCSITSFRDTKPNPEIWLNTFSEPQRGSLAQPAIDAKKKAGEADSVFKGFTPFASHIRKMSPPQIRARFASSKIHPSLLAYPTPTVDKPLWGNARGVKKSGYNPSFSWFSAARDNNNQNDNRAFVHKVMPTYATTPEFRTKFGITPMGEGLTGGLSSFFHDPMLPPLKQGEKKQAQKKKRREEGNEVPHIEENPGFKNRDDVWWNQKYRELAENNKTKFLIRELSIKISNLTHVLPYSHFLSNQSNNVALLTLPPPPTVGYPFGVSFAKSPNFVRISTVGAAKINPTVMSTGLIMLPPVSITPEGFTTFDGPRQSPAARSPEGTGSIGLLRVLPQKEELIFNLTKYRQKQQKLNYLGFIPYSFEQPKELNITSQSRKPLWGNATRWALAKPGTGSVASGKTRFNSGLIKEYALGTKKQMLEKKSTSKFWWLKNASFKALYAQHRVLNSDKTGNAKCTNSTTPEYPHRGITPMGEGFIGCATSQLINKAEVTTMLHIMHGRITGIRNCNNNENKPLPLLSWLTSLSQPRPIVFTKVRKGYTNSSLNETSSWVVSATSNLTKPPAALPGVEEPIFISLFSMATTVFFHFCCLIGLLSISQVRCAIKFYFILFYKLSKSYIQLINSLYGWTFQYPLSHYYPAITFATHGKVNAFFKYSKGLVLTKSFTVGYLHTCKTLRSYLPSYPFGVGDQASAVLPALYPQSMVSASNLLRSRLREPRSGARLAKPGSMKNSPTPFGTGRLRYNILVWLNKRAVFLVARIESVLPDFAFLSWKGKKELKLLPAVTSLALPLSTARGTKPTPYGVSKAELALALFNKFFVLFLPKRYLDVVQVKVSKQSSMLPLMGLAKPTSMKQLFGLKLQIELLNAKNIISFIRNNSIKTTVTVLQKSRFLFIKSVSLLVFFIQDCFEAVLRFFENPTELSLDFFAYTFLVELYSDSLSIMPEIMDLTIWNWFQKTTGSLKTSLFFGNLLQRRFFCFFYILLNTLNQPDTALIRQQVKGSLFWDLWADLLIKTVVSENQLDVSSLARLEEERTSLVDSLLFEALPEGVPSLFDLLLPFWGSGANATRGFAFRSLDNASLATGNLSPLGYQGSKLRFFSLPTVEGMKKPYNTKFLHLTKIKHNFLNSQNASHKLPMVNPLEISTDSSGPLYANPTPYRVSKESKAEKRWGANQHVSYQQIDTDLFVDLNVSKSFSHVSGIKYYAGVQYPIGSLVCQIYTGLFETQAAKNVLVIGPASASTKTFDAKSLLIQALAGETEIKIIIDNAARYTLVNRGLAVGIRLLKEVFNAIALQTPCFFLLEDVHLIGEKRLLLISDSSDAKKILNNQMPLSHIDALEVHEKNQVMIQYSKQAVTHYKKPYRDSAEQSIATSQYCFDFFLGNKNKKSNPYGGSKRVKGTSLPSPIPIISLSLNQSNSTKQKLKPKKFLDEISFEENSKEPELILVPRINYSVRLKVALLAQHTLSNFSAKVDMITDLLVIIDNVRSNKGFVVFATTNRAHRLDPALRRPGRLDETIRVPFLPTASARWEILKSNLGVFFKSTFSPFNVKRSVCLDLIEFTNFNIQVNSSLILSPLPPFYPLAQAGLLLPQVGIEQRLFQDQPLPNKLAPRIIIEEVACLPYPAKVLPLVGIMPTVVDGSLLPQRGTKLSELAATRLTPKGLVPRRGAPKSPTGVLYFSTPKKPKIYLLGDIGSEKIKIMAYCKVAKKLILNSTVAMGSSMVAGCYPNGVKPDSITSVSSATNVFKLPSVYAKGNNLYWNSITWKEKTFITSVSSATEQIPQRGTKVTPLQLLGGNQTAKDARSTLLELEKSEGEWEIPQDTTDAALSISTVKRKLLNLFASKVAESFVCELFCVNQNNPFGELLITLSEPGQSPAAGSSVVPTAGRGSSQVESQSLVGGLGRKSVGFFNALTLDHMPSNDWKKASSLVKSFLQKRYMYNKNTIVNSLLCVANGSFVGEFKDEPTNPPHSVILAPSKRYENYKKIFAKHEKKVFIKITEKAQLHEQQKFIKNLYTFQNSKGDGPTVCRMHNAPVGGENASDNLPEVMLPTASMGSGKIMKGGQNHLNPGNAGQTFRPGLALTDPNSKESNINNSIDGNYSKLSSVSWYYNASIVKRHQFYLTNQWFNGQLAEHNAETVFLSDVDWRLTFIEELGDLSIDFPDADQLYNPRHRRWLLNTSSLSGGTASSWHTFYNYDQEISDHLVMQAFNKIYVLLDKNRQQLDALSYKLIKTGFLKELHLVKLVL